MKHDDVKKKMDMINNFEAIEQTFLSWVQTGLTLIGVGFGIGTILVAMKAEHYERTIIKAIKIVGALLILVGFITIILSLIQHRSKLKSLKGERTKKKYLTNLPLWIGIMIIILGIIAFLTILAHLIF